MISDRFINEVNGIYQYYKDVGNSLLLSIGQDSANSTKKKHVEYLRQTIPIMFCMAWEKFCKELEDNEPEKFKACFENRGNKYWDMYYNDSIAEIILKRNCLVHGEYLVSKYLIEAFPGRYILKDKLPEITDTELDNQYTHFISVFEKIKNSSLSLLP